METCELDVLVFINCIQFNMLGLKRKKPQMNVSTIRSRSPNSSELPKKFPNAQQADISNMAAETKDILFSSLWGDIDPNANPVETTVAIISGTTVLGEPKKRLTKNNSTNNNSTTACP